MFIVLSLFTLYLFMMGYVSTSFLRTGGPRFEQVALTLSAGILINYCLMLTGQTIPRVLVAGMFLALWGMVRFYADLRTRPFSGTGDYATSVASVCFIVYILVVYYFAILSEPLGVWDARSIWFFHAKMIWTEGALRQHTGWTHPSLGFSHPDYPELIPALAAQLGYLKGYWNEFLPKGSLWLMLVPLTLWVFSFRRKRASFIVLVVIFFFSLGVAWLANGLMDGYVALYCGAALLSLGRFLSERRDTDLYSAVCALGIGAGLKNEALLFVVCLLVALFAIGLTYPALRFSQFASRLRTDVQLAKFLILSIAPTLIWMVYKQAWGLQNDVVGDPRSALSRLSTRVFDGFSLEYVFNYLTVRASSIWALIGLVALGAVISARQKLTLPRGALVAATTSALYVCGLYAVYLSSPHDVTFHLFTSATRTMATASVALFVSLFFLLSGLEAET